MSKQNCNYNVLLQETIHSEFITECFDRLKARYENLKCLSKGLVEEREMEANRMIRFLTVLYEYVSECDETYADERALLSLSRYVQFSILIGQVYIALSSHWSGVLVQLSVLIGQVCIFLYSHWSGVCIALNSLCPGIHSSQFSLTGYVQLSITVGQESTVLQSLSHWWGVYKILCTTIIQCNEVQEESVG